MNILKPSIARTTAKGQAGTYFVLSGSAGPALGAVLSGSSPLSMISIDDNVDLTATSALNNDLLIGTFGYRPVAITLRGLDIYSTSCYGGGMSMAGFYALFNVHRNPLARVDVGIYRGGYGSAYRCVAIGLTCSAEAGSARRGVGECALNLVGVRL